MVKVGSRQREGRVKGKAARVLNRSGHGTNDYIIEVKGGKERQKRGSRDRKRKAKPGVKGETGAMEATAQKKKKRNDER